MSYPPKTFIPAANGNFNLISPIRASRDFAREASDQKL
jgi:hypothetical protein